MLVSEFLEKNKIVIMPQPLYLPDLAPPDCFLFPKQKTPMKEKRFATIEEIKEKSKQELLARFRRVSRIGTNAGISVLYLRRVTLKATR